jgi:hypothetical protein
MKKDYALEVLNPRGILGAKGFQGLLTPRPATLEGKRIAILHEKPDSLLFFDPLEKFLKERYPTAEIGRIEGGIHILDEAHIEQLKKYDVFIEGVRSTAGSEGDKPVAFEKAGIPGVHVALDEMLPQRKRCARANGIPTIRIVVVPCERWFATENKKENFESLVKDYVDDIIHALTDPLTEEEKNPRPIEYDYSSLRFEGSDYSEALDSFQTYYLNHGLCDGIAVVPPTKEAVDRMLTGSNFSRDEVLGIMSPGFGEATVEKVAINAVMAGAKPEYLPVIITAVRMLCEPAFDLYHLVSSIVQTHLFVAVNGPIAKELGMTSGMGYLGPGNPVNNVIGRAISLCLINLGWLDFDFDSGMSGQPSRFCNIVFCENDDSPWKQYSALKGFSTEDSTVMVEEAMGIEAGFLGPDSMPSGLWTEGVEADLEKLVKKVMPGKSTLQLAMEQANDLHSPVLARSKTVLQQISARTYMLIIHPWLAEQLAARGYTKESLIRYLCDSHRLPWEYFSGKVQAEILELAKSGDMPALTADDCKPGGKIPVMNYEKLAVFVAGPKEGQSLGFISQGSYNGFRRGYYAPGKPVFNIRKITNAMLTKAGK